MAITEASTQRNRPSAGVLKPARQVARQPVGTWIRLHDEWWLVLAVRDDGHELFLRAGSNPNRTLHHSR